METKIIQNGKANDKDICPGSYENTEIFCAI
jgi:hypothetical protein